MAVAVEPVDDNGDEMDAMAVLAAAKGGRALAGQSAVFRRLRGRIGVVKPAIVAIPVDRKAGRVGDGNEAANGWRWIRRRIHLDLVDVRAAIGNFDPQTGRWNRPASDRNIIAVAQIGAKNEVV